MLSHAEGHALRSRVRAAQPQGSRAAAPLTSTCSTPLMQAREVASAMRDLGIELVITSPFRSELASYS